MQSVRQLPAIHMERIRCRVVRVTARAKPKSTSPRRSQHEMEPFTKALEVVAQVMRNGALTHSDNGWVRRTPEYHLARAAEHLLLWREGDQTADHVSLAATLMALTLREIE